MLYGILLNIAGSILINAGTNLIKLSHTLHDTSEDTKDRPVYVIGLTLFLVGNGLNFTSFSFAPQSLLAALGSAQFVSNVFFGRIVLKETVTLRILIATGIILLGNILVVYSFSAPSLDPDNSDIRIHSKQQQHQQYDEDFSNSSNNTDNDSNNIQLEAALIRSNFDHSYGIFVTQLCILFVAFYCYYYRIQSVARAKLTKFEQEYFNLLKPLSFSAYSAILGSQSVLFAKCLSIIVRAEIVNNRCDDDIDPRCTTNSSWQSMGALTYLLFIGWAVSITFWLKQMNRALALFHGLFIIPCLQVMWTFFSILCGGVFFKEFVAFSDVQAVGFCTGVCVVFAGVYLLAPRDNNKSSISNNKPSVPASLSKSSNIQTEDELQTLSDNHHDDDAVFIVTSDAEDECYVRPHIDTQDEHAIIEAIQMSTIVSSSNNNDLNGGGCIRSRINTRNEDEICSNIIQSVSSPLTDSSPGFRSRKNTREDVTKVILDECISPNNKRDSNCSSKVSGNIV